VGDNKSIDEQYILDVNICPFTTIAVLEHQKNIEGEGLGSRQLFLKMDAINLSILFSTTQFLRFSIIVRTAYNKSYTTYILFNS
jgi:hypothetical protein